MNDINVSEIKTSLYGLNNGFMQLDVLSTVYERGTVEFGGMSMPLTATQKTQIKTECQALAAALKNTADTLAAPTGKTGVVQNDTKESFISQPRTTWEHVSKQWERANILLQMDPVRKPDGTFRIEYADPIPQELANTLVTIKDGVYAFTTVLEARLK